MEDIFEKRQKRSAGEPLRETQEEITAKQETGDKAKTETASVRDACMEGEPAMRKKKLWVLLLTLCLSVSPDNISAAAAENESEAVQEREDGAGAGTEENTENKAADQVFQAAEETGTETASGKSAGEDDAQKPAEDGTADNEPGGSEELTPADKTGASDNNIDESKDPEQGSDAADGLQVIPEKEAAAEEDLPLLTEAANINNVLFTSIARSLNATITMEQSREPEYTEEELMYLACIIYCEAGNQSFTGKVAVANVVMNRAESDVFDHVTTIREAVYDCDRWGRQFSPVYVKRDGRWTTKGSSYEKALTMYKTGEYAKEWQKTQMDGCIEAAEAALEGKYVLDGDYLYFNMGISSTKSKCKKNGKPWQVIGCHIFY